MKFASSALKAFLPSTRQFFEADLFTITPAGGLDENLILWSQDLSKSVWTRSANGAANAPVVTPNAVAAPDGSMTAAKIAFPSASSGQNPDVFETLSYPTASTAYTFSVWLRTDSTGSITLEIADNPTTQSQTVVANLTSAWQRFSLTFTFPAGTNPQVLPVLLNEGPAPALNVYAWGAKLNRATSPGAYIYTAGQPVLNVGAPLRITSSDRDVVWAVTPGDFPSVFSSDNPLISRGQMRWGVGLTVDTLDLTLLEQAPVTLTPQIAQGYLDGARVQLDRLYGTAFGAWIDSVTLFAGNVADVKELGRSHAKIEVRSRLELLNNSLPRNLFQPSCRWSLFDSGCTLNKSSFGTSLTVSAVANSLQFTSGATQIDGYYDLGTLTFTSGANAGVSVTVKHFLHSSGTFILNSPLAVAPGDAFIAYPGCDKQQSTCSGKFSNLVNFGGMPYIPVPESAV